MARTYAAALSALVPLCLSWSGMASAQQAPAQDTPPPTSAPAAPQTQQPVAAGTIAPQVFTLPQQPFRLTPRIRDTFDENQPVIGPRAVPQAPDNGLSIGPFVLREDPTPDAGCRWSLRGNKVRFRCRM